MFKKYLIIIFLIVVRQASAGLLDSIITCEILISLEKSDSIRQQFEHAEQFCLLPGSVFNFSNDSICFNPVQEYIDKYMARSDDTSDSLHRADSLKIIDYRIAMQTYWKFRRIENKDGQSHTFSHAAFIKDLEDEKPVLQKTFLVKMLEKVIGWIEKHILIPLAGIISDSIGKMPLLLKVIVTATAIAAFIFLVIIIAGFTRRIYPNIEVYYNKPESQGHNLYSSETNWLAKARDYAADSRLTDASECIYRHLIQWFVNRDKIRRYEWWTNRQLLHIIEKRFHDDYKDAETIITTYERCIFGHIPADEKMIGQLIEKAAMLRGKRSS